MQAPTISDLLNDPTILQALEDAWADSETTDPARRHEEGGWVYIETSSGAVSIRRASGGAAASVDLTAPPVVAGSLVVATFHTHPNPIADGWDPGPSQQDTQSALSLVVHCLIRAEDGIHTTGPTSRRGGLAGG